MQGGPAARRPQGTWPIRRRNEPLGGHKVTLRPSHQPHVSRVRAWNLPFIPTLLSPVALLLGLACLLATTKGVRLPRGPQNRDVSVKPYPTDCRATQFEQAWKEQKKTRHSIWTQKTGENLTWQPASSDRLDLLVYQLVSHTRTQALTSQLLEPAPLACRPGSQPSCRGRLSLQAQQGDTSRFVGTQSHLQAARVGHHHQASSQDSTRLALTQ